MDAHEKDLNIQWYPGHMTKTRRMIAEQLRHMDAVCEILDARAPLSSRNPDVGELTAGKPRLIVLNRVDLADPAATKAWGAWFRGQDAAVLECNARQGQGTRQFPAAVRSLLSDKLAAYAERGQAGRMLRVMILGIPNVGKSTAPASPAPSSGSRWTRVWSCWTPLGCCGPNLRTLEWPSGWPAPARCGTRSWTWRSWPPG